MRSVRVQRLALALALLVAGGCSSSGEAPDAPALTRYDDVEVAKTDLKAMLGTLGADEGQVAALLKAFDGMLGQPELAKVVHDQGIAATCASVGGAGGVIVRVNQGHGLVCFPNGRKSVPVDVSGWTAGATIGGDRSYSVGIAIGLVKESDFVGEYDVTVHGSGAGEGGSRSGTGRSKKGGHELHWVGTTVGFGGDVSAGTVTISWEDVK